LTESKDGGGWMDGWMEGMRADYRVHNTAIFVSDQVLPNIFTKYPKWNKRCIRSKCTVCNRWFIVCDTRVSVTHEMKKESSIFDTGRRVSFPLIGAD